MKKEKNPAAVALGSLGGKAKTEKQQATRSKNIANAPKFQPIPTKCRRCGKLQPSAREAWRHKCGDEK